MSCKNHFDLQIEPLHLTQGPVGPHLFFTSTGIGNDLMHDTILQMSPLYPKERALSAPAKRNHHKARQPYLTVPSQVDIQVLKNEESDVYSWSTQRVTLWLRDAGIDESTIDKFRHHDITGPVLLDLDFDDLKQLDMNSFGKRHQVWTAIEELRALMESDIASPAARKHGRRSTGLTRSPSKRQDVAQQIACDRSPSTSPTCTSRQRAIRRDPLAPGDSISIVAIEEVVPKAHWCRKGEKCSTYKKRQRLLEQMDSEYGTSLSPSYNSTAIQHEDVSPKQRKDERPETVESVTPSLIGSSDVLGPTHPPNLVMHEGILEQLDRSHPQEIVKQYLTLQHVPESAYIPPYPPQQDGVSLEMFPREHFIMTPPSEVPNLPRPLDMPHSANAVPKANMSPTRSLTSSPWSSMFRRRGTPASCTDIPSRGILIMPPGLRQESQSVPPDMRYRPPIALQAGARDPLQWRRLSMRLPTVRESTSEDSSAVDAVQAVPRSGWMHKRKNKILRHDWIRQHVRLNGTQLAMHVTSHTLDTAPVETVDVKDYDVALKQKIADSKLNAALKTLRIASGKNSISGRMYGLDLVPSEMESNNKLVALLQANKEPKVHHFAIDTQAERGEWIRELMLAKARGQQADGYDVVIHGEMI